MMSIEIQPQKGTKLAFQTTIPQVKPLHTPSPESPTEKTKMYIIKEEADNEVDSAKGQGHYKSQ